jgi:conjugative relaxase-like TrwC/TraI family protein
MITVSQAMSASQASDYFVGGAGDEGSEIVEAFAEKETDASSKQISKSNWSGELAEQFNLEGKVKKEDFDKVLEGINPLNDERLIRRRKQSETKRDIESKTSKISDSNKESSPEKEKDENKDANKNARKNVKSKTAEHRACWDITFSSPKSVSLAAIVGGDTRLLEAHRQSVSTALKMVEKFAEARLGGNKPAEQTGKLLIASFEHYTARPDKKNKFAAVDLHTHNTVMNFTFAENGRSYSLQPKKLFEVQKLGTAVYRLELAKKISELGYKIRVDEKTKAPEISAVSRKYIEAVSPRQNEIKEKARELNIVSTRGIAVRYRSAKSEKTADNIKFHQRLEQQFDNQAEFAVKESFEQKGIEQKEIIEKLEIEVKKLQKQRLQKSEQKNQKYNIKQTERQKNEQPGIEDNTSKRIAAFPAIIGNEPERNRVGIDNFKPESKRETVRQSGSIANARGISNTNLENIEQTVSKDRLSRPRIVEDKFGTFKHEENTPKRITQGQQFGFSDDQKRQIDSGKTSSISEPTSSKSTARIGNVEVKEHQPSTTTEQNSDNSANQKTKPNTVGTETVADHRNKTDFEQPLRTDLLQSTDETADRNSEVESAGGNNGDLRRNRNNGENVSGSIALLEGSDSLPNICPDSICDIYSDNLFDISRFADVSDINDFGNSNNNRHIDNRNSLDNNDLSGLLSTSDAENSLIFADLRVWDNNNVLLRQSLSEPERREEMASNTATFDADYFTAEFARYETDESDYAKSLEFDYTNQFVEIEQLFKTQEQKETLANEIVEAANNQSLQNRQTEINQAVQETMFAYLMQMSETNNQNDNQNDSGDNLTSLDSLHQSSLTGVQNLEALTRRCEEMHRTEEAETKEEPASSTARTNSFRYPSDEEIEAYKNEMYGQDCERSLSLQRN